MNQEGYSPRIVVVGVTTAGTSELDNRAIVIEKALLVKYINAIAAERILAKELELNVAF
jgi:hypothetical protein